MQKSPSYDTFNFSSPPTTFGETLNYFLMVSCVELGPTKWTQANNTLISVKLPPDIQNLLHELADATNNISKADAESSLINILVLIGLGKLAEEMYQASKEGTLLGPKELIEKLGSMILNKTMKGASKCQQQQQQPTQY